MALFLIEVEESTVQVKANTKESNHFIDAIKGLINVLAQKDNEEVGVILGTVVSILYDEK